MISHCASLPLFGTLIDFGHCKINCFCLIAVTLWCGQALDHWLKVVSKGLCTIPDFCTRPNFICFGNLHWGFHGYFHARERASNWGAECLAQSRCAYGLVFGFAPSENGLTWSGLGPQRYSGPTSIWWDCLFKYLLIPLARKADSLYGFQFRRNLNLCVHLAWRYRWDEQ